MDFYIWVIRKGYCNSNVLVSDILSVQDSAEINSKKRKRDGEKLSAPSTKVSCLFTHIKLFLNMLLGHNLSANGDASKVMDDGARSLITVLLRRVFTLTSLLVTKVKSSHFNQLSSDKLVTVGIKCIVNHESLPLISCDQSEYKIVLDSIEKLFFDLTSRSVVSTAEWATYFGDNGMDSIIPSLVDSNIMSADIEYDKIDRLCRTISLLNRCGLIHILLPVPKDACFGIGAVALKLNTQVLSSLTPLQGRMVSVVLNLALELGWAAEVSEGVSGNVFK